MKWKVGELLLGVGLMTLALIVDRGEGGKTLKLPHYDVKFGTWPLMEVTRTGSVFKHGRGRGPRLLGKGVAGRGIGLRKRPPKGYRLGPPPPAGNLVLINAARQNRGTIHKHLQDTLKMYAGDKGSSLNLPSLPIIVRAPGPNAPPPPPGYALGPSSGPVAGPPTLITSTPPRSSRLVSMLQTAAYSGIFKDTVDTYVSPGFNPGPPPSGTYQSILSDGTLVETLVGDDFRSTPRDPSPVEPKPSVPPVITVGGPLPENYTLSYAQRSVVAIKSPDPFEKSGIVNPGASEYDVGVDLGTKYEQGYGAKPPPSHPVVITKFQKRGDVHHKPEKLVEQDLPDSGLILTTNVVYNTPNISAPLGGRSSELFKAALRDKKKEEKLRKKEQPLDAQVKLLGRLFTKMQRIQPPKVPVPEEEAEEGKFVEVGGGWGQPDGDGEWKYVAKSKVDSPIMAVQVQTWSAPEIHSADSDIIESMAEFGEHDIKFGESDGIVSLLETAMNQGGPRISIRDLGSNPEEVNENLLNWVRRHLTIVRDVNGDAHAHGEKIASDQFKQFQTFITPPFGQNGWAPGEGMPVDPKKGSRGFSETDSQSMARFS